MADPTPYSRGYSYASHERSNPTQPKPGPQLDNDFDNISRSVRETIAALKDIRRSDGPLNNLLVTYDSLSQPLRDRLDYIHAVKGDLEKTLTAVRQFAERAKAGADKAETEAAKAETEAVAANGHASMAASSLAGCLVAVAQTAAHERGANEAKDITRAFASGASISALAARDSEAAAGGYAESALKSADRAEDAAGVVARVEIGTTTFGEFYRQIPANVGSKKIDLGDLSIRHPFASERVPAHRMLLRQGNTLISLGAL